MPEEPEPTPEEWAAIEAADAYLDAVGNKRDFDGDQLGATEWRKDVDREPLNDLPSDHIARGELPPAPATGGRMSAAEEAARLRRIASENQDMVGMLVHAFDVLVGINAEVGEALGAGHSELENAQGPIQQAAINLGNVRDELAGALNNLNDIANRIG